MSDKNEIAVRPTTPFTLREQEEVNNYREAGLPDIIDVTDEKLMSAYDMFLDGIRFLEIAKSLKIKKVQVMYLVDKYKWHDRRMEFLDETELHIKNRVVEEKLRSQTFLMKTMHAFRRRMNKKVDLYLTTGDEKIGDTIDFKEMSLYVKMAETVAELDVKGIAKDPNGNPLIGINAGDGVNIRKQEDGSLEITPRQKTHAQMLADLANMKREQNKDTKKT